MMRTFDLPHQYRSLYCDAAAVAYVAQTSSVLKWDTMFSLLSIVVLSLLRPPSLQRRSEGADIAQACYDVRVSIEVEAPDRLAGAVVQCPEGGAE